MRKERKHYTAEEKVAILRRHLLAKIPVSDLCEELGLQPTVFYRWQKEFCENGAAAFQFTPTYFSWLNQVELWFAKIQRDVISRGVFTSVADLPRKVRKYIAAYSKS